MRAAWVYFVRADAFIKVGVARDIKKRLAGLQTGNPHELEVLGVLPGSGRLEKMLHHRFGLYRVRTTEWFVAAQELVAFAKTCDQRFASFRARARPQILTTTDVVVASVAEVCSAICTHFNAAAGEDRERLGNAITRAIRALTACLAADDAALPGPDVAIDVANVARQHRARRA